MPLVIAAVAVAYLWQAWSIPLDPWSAEEAINARTLPFVYGFVLLALSVVLAVSPSPPPTPTPTPTPIPTPPSTTTPDTPKDSDRPRSVTLAAHCLAIVAFGVLIHFAGLWIATAALLAAALLIAGERRPIVLVVAPLATAAIAWSLIAVVLNVYIGPGVWFS